MFIRKNIKKKLMKTLFTFILTFLRPLLLFALLLSIYQISHNYFYNNRKGGGAGERIERIWNHKLFQIKHFFLIKNFQQNGNINLGKYFNQTHDL